MDNIIRQIKEKQKYAAELSRCAKHKSDKKYYLGMATAYRICLNGLKILNEDEKFGGGTTEQ